MKKQFLTISIFLFAINTYTQEIKEFRSGMIEVLNDKVAYQSENLYTGTIKTQIPIYVYKDQDFELPIVLNNNSSGYKTYTSIGTIGLNWDLSFGGYITRQVNGIPDETTTFMYNNSPSYPKNPFLRGYKYYWSNTNGSSFIEKIEKGKVLYSSSNGEYFFGIENKNLPNNTDFVETTPDLFTFNFIGHNGKFMLNNQGTISVFDTTNPVGEYQVDIESLGYDFLNPVVRIIITTGDGYKYVFEDKTSYNSNAIKFGAGPHLSTETYSNYYPLIEIEAPNGRKVKFIYNNKVYNTTIKYYFSKNADWSSSNDGTRFGISSGYLTDAANIQTIDKIIIDNTQICFKYINRDKELVYLTRSQNSFTEELSTLPLLDKINVENSIIDQSLFNISFSYNFSKDIGYKESRKVPLLKKITLNNNENYGIEYYSEESTFPTLLHGRDFWGFWNNSDLAKDLPIANTDKVTNYETIVGDEYKPNFEASLLGMLKKITYPTGGYTLYYYEPNSYESRVVKDNRNNGIYQNNTYLEETPLTIAGGVRVRRVTDYLSTSDSVFTDYSYTGGILLHTPRFYREVNQNVSSNRIKQISWNNSFIATKDGITVSYSEVIKKQDNKHYTKYKFSDYRMFPDLNHLSLFNISLRKKFKIYDYTNADIEYPDNFFSQNNSRHRIRGKLLSKEYYSAENNLVYSESYQYDFNRFNSDNRSIDSDYNILPSERNIYYINQAYSYFYVQKEYTRSCLLKTIVRQHYIDEPINETINYKYNNAEQVQTVEKELSNGKKTITKTLYPFDLLSTGGWQNIYDNMHDNGFRKFPIKIQSKIDDIGITNYIINNYGNFRNVDSPLYCIEMTKSLKIEKPLLLNDFDEELNSYLKTEFTYDYYNMGNLKTVITKEGNTTTYIWSYNNQYPIAEIKNATYTQVQSAVPGFLSFIEQHTNPSDLQLNSLFSSLRANLPDAQITTYTYKPLVGVTSATDPRGVTTYYEYDDFNRLKQTYIIEGGVKKILQENKYNYANQ